MKAAGISDIKRELSQKSEKELMELVLATAKFKKENKELLSYLIFHAEDEATYVTDCKEEMKKVFDTIQLSHVYYAKKGVRKTLRYAQRCIKYSPEASTEVELLGYFLDLFFTLPNEVIRQQAMRFLAERQWIKIDKALSSLHEDIQADYRMEKRKWEGYFIQ